MVSFALAPEATALADSAARVVRERYADQGERRFDAARWREFAELGWLAAAIGEPHGGLGLPWSTLSVLAERLAPAVAVEPLATQVALGGYLLDQAQSSAVRDAALARWLGGECLVALVHERDGEAPWQSAALATRFVRDGDDCVLHGQCALLVDGELAHLLLVSASDAAGEVALFVVDGDARGLERRARPAIDGRTHQQVVLDGVRVAPAARLVFTEGAAPALAASAWLHALLSGAEGVGLLAALLHDTHHYLVQREQFGRPLIEFQVLQHRLVDMLLTLTRLESLLAIARCKCDELGPGAAAPYIAALKAALGEEGRALARAAVQLHGAIGVTAELAVGRQVRRLMSLEMLAGSTAQHAACWGAARESVAPRAACDSVC